jgi:hypothetical protein
LHYKSQPPSLIYKYFFIVQLLMIVSLMGLYKGSMKDTKIKWLLLIGSIGLLWIAITRTIEAFGASGPWGLFGSPGLVIFCLSTFLAGNAITKSLPLKDIGKVLKLISLLHIAGSLGSLVAYNVLGGTLEANRVASTVLQFAMMAEGLAWVRLGQVVRKTSNLAKPPAHFSPV